MKRASAWRGRARRVAAGLLVVALGALASCAPKLASPEELAAFNAAGPVRPLVDRAKLEQAAAAVGEYRVGPGDLLELRVQPVRDTPRPAAEARPAERAPQAAAPGPYRVGPGDVLEVEMPGILRAVGVQLPEGVVTTSQRVSEKGTITLPGVGAVEVAGKTLGEIDEAIVGAYHPKLVRERPSVLTQVREYRTVTVAVVGAVGQPGRVALRSDERSLLAALLKVGGLSPSAAGRVLIRRAGEAEPLVVALSGRDVPGQDVPLHGGEVIEVERGFARDEGVEPFVCRVGQAGTIRVPGAGDVAVGGKTLAEVEAAVAAACGAGAEAARPSVLARLVEPRTAQVTLLGGVERPGRYELRRDEMSLVALLMKAGGILPEGAGLIRIRHAGPAKDVETVALPVRDVNVPFADVALRDGDVVEVVRLEQRVFTLLGLVQQPGTFPYPQTARYNLAQAVAVAGGLDPVADPRYLSIYRQDAQGELVSARFKLAGNRLSESANVPIRPGDIVLVEHTLRTRTRKFFSNLFRTGVFVGASYRLDNRDDD